MKTKKKRKTTIVVDFTGVESGLGVRVPEADYPFKIASAKGMTGKESEKPYIESRFEITKGKHKGKKLRYPTIFVKSNLTALEGTS